MCHSRDEHKTNTSYLCRRTITRFKVEDLPVRLLRLKIKRFCLFKIRPGSPPTYIHCFLRLPCLYRHENGLKF